MKKRSLNRALAVLLLAGVCAAVLGAAQRSNPAETALQAAIHKAVVEGDLRQAIRMYNEVASKYSSNRAVAAEALLRMAEAYEKLGAADARKVYERIAREYGEQRQAATARERIGQSAVSASRTLGDRVVWATEAAIDSGRVSSDGRLISYTDYIWTGNLMLHDVVTGEDRPLTGNKDWSVGLATGSAISRDRKRVAYGWQSFGETKNTSDIRIVSVEETGIPQPVRGTANDDVSSFSPADWSPDGKWLAVGVQRRDRTRQIALVEVNGNSYRTLKTVGWNGPGNIRFSSDGKYIAYDLPANDDASQRDVFLMALDGNREMPLVQHDANDRFMGWSPDGSTVLFASDRSGSTGLWALPVVNGKAPAPPALLKSNIDGSPLGLTLSGALYIARSASTQALQVAPIDVQSGKLTGVPVFQSVANQADRPVWSPDGRYLAFGPGSTLAIREVETGKVRELRPALGYLFSLNWMPDGQSLIVAARDSRGRNGIYRIDSQTGATTLIKDVTTGGIQVSPDGKSIFYNDGPMNTGDEPKRFVEHDLDSGETRAAPAGTRLPDGRNVVAVRTDDVAKTSAVVLRPMAGHEERELIKVSLPGRFVDVRWTSNGDTVVAVRRWENADKQGEVWIIPVNGGSARKLDIDMKDWLVDSGVHLDPQGKQIAFFTGKSSSEVWVLENLLPTHR